MKKSFYISWLLLFGVIASSLAQTISPAGSAAVPGISKDRIDHIDAMLEQAIQQQNVPGLVAMIVKEGKIVYQRKNSLPFS